MRRFAKIVIALIGLSIFLPTLRVTPQVNRNTPSLKEKLDKNVENFETAGRTLIQSVLDIAYQHELPMGIEYLSRDALSRPIDLRFQNESIGKFLSH